MQALCIHCACIYTNVVVTLCSSCAHIVQTIYAGHEHTLCRQFWSYYVGHLHTLCSQFMQDLYTYYSCIYVGNMVTLFMSCAHIVQSILCMPCAYFVQENLVTLWRPHAHNVQPIYAGHGHILCKQFMQAMCTLCAGIFGYIMHVMCTHCATHLCRLYHTLCMQFMQASCRHIIVHALNEGINLN